jgi:hypothetical protein
MFPRLYHEDQFRLARGLSLSAVYLGAMMVAAHKLKYYALNKSDFIHMTVFLTVFAKTASRKGLLDQALAV